MKGSTTVSRRYLGASEEELHSARVARDVIKINWPFSLNIFDRPPARELSHGKGAKVAMHVASSLCHHFCRTSVTPELLLFSLLQDDEVLAAVSPPEEELEQLTVDAMQFDDKERDDDGWSLRVKMALYTTWDRAERHGRKLVTRGDLISGLAGMGGQVGLILAESDVDYERLDRDPPEGWLASLPEVTDGKDDETVWVVVINDDVTTMEFVTDVLRERFGCTQTLAVHHMCATHYLGEAKVGELELETARTRVDRALRDARKKEFPFQIRIVQPRPQPHDGPYR